MAKPTDLKSAITELLAAPRVDIKGKQYAQVNTRIEIFRKYFGHEYGIATEFIQVHDLNLATVRAQIIDLSNGLVVASGLAQEDRTQGKVNHTSAVENAETSAIGRALACFGLAGGEYASVNEMTHVLYPEEVPVNSSSQSNRDYGNMPPRERAFREAVDQSFPPPVNQYQFYLPANNAPEEIDKVFVEIDQIGNLAELMAYFSALEEWFQWLKPDDFQEVKASFSARKNQLKG